VFGESSVNRLSSPSSHEPPRVLHRIHADTVGAMSTPGVEGEKFSVTIVDELSNFCSVLPVTSKATIASHLTDTITYWERQTESKVKAVRTDRGTEFLNKTLHGFCTENGIHTETSAAYTPQQNGVAERMNRTLKEKARTMLLGVQADESLWVDAMLTAAYLHNVMPVSGQEKTPFEMFTGSVPDLSHLRKWGCLAYVRHAKHQVSSLGDSLRQECLWDTAHTPRGTRSDCLVGLWCPRVSILWRPRVVHLPLACKQLDLVLSLQPSLDLAWTWTQSLPNLDPALTRPRIPWQWRPLHPLSVIECTS
jgi:transposase InsO family protein